MQKAFNITLFLMFLVGTMITFVIMYKDFDSPHTTKFIIGYVVYLLLYAFWLLLTVLINSRTLTWSQIRKKLLTFIIWFLALSAAQYLFSYFFSNSEFEIWDFGIPLGVSFGLAFSDMMYTKRKENICD
jgi:hypothetical protein